jgi:alpha,alpha-trehalase
MNRSWQTLCIAISLCLFAAATALSQVIPVPENLWRLVAQEDTDGDRRITVRDHTTPFTIRDKNGAALREVDGVYPLSILLQELKRAEEGHRNEMSMAQVNLDEPVVDRTHRLIKEFSWDALTRRIDAEHLAQVVHDPKAASAVDHLYVPASDPVAVRYFQALERSSIGHEGGRAIKVVILPAPCEAADQLVRHLDGEHGILKRYRGILFHP